MKKYKIAFFTVDWNYELVESTLHGMKQFSEERPDIDFFVFDCFGKDEDNSRSWIEYGIFSLPDLSGFDGALLQGNQIVLSSARNKIAERIRAAGIPAVTIDCPVEDFTLIGIDNRDAQRAITEHLIQVHGARRLVYLTGIEGNDCPEADDRRNGFLDACKDNGLSQENIWIYHCSWRTVDGKQVAQEWLENGRPLPDAFVCANDEMAFGVIETLQEHDIRIPEDVRVVGFDNVSSAELVSPRLSTIRRDYEKLNYHAMEILMSMIEGTPSPHIHPFPYEMICSSSCGCAASREFENTRTLFYQQTKFLKQFYMLQDAMAEALFSATSLSALLDIVENTYSVFGCDNLFLCMNELYYLSYERDVEKKHRAYFDDTMLLVACGKRKQEPDENHVYASFPRSELLPEFITRDENYLIFYPLHYNSTSIGYIVLNGLCQAAKLNLHESIINFIEIAIENVRKKMLLQRLNQILDDQYVHDALTGLHNRFGYKRYAEDIYKNLLDENGSALIAFADVDNLKEINDKYGHECGDNVIRAAAGALQASIGSDGFLMRYGGDEFLVICSGTREELSSRIRSRLKGVTVPGPDDIPVALSIGVIKVNRLEKKPLEKCVQEADMRMYQTKMERKHKFW